MSEIPKPRIWCQSFCGNWVENFDEPGDRGAVFVRLGREAFWFCGPCCASSFLDSICRTWTGEASELYVLLLNTLSEN